MGARYPLALWRPWKYPAGAPSEHVGKATYYKGQNKPICVVLHIMAGWAGTALQWAEQGFFPKSWHFTVARDGTVYQHLELEDGGYHAGISASQARRYPPGWYLSGIPGERQFVHWPLWKGPFVNVNNYSIGIEMEGFPDMDRTIDQETSLYRLCTWLSQTLSIPWDYVHFPPHAVIDRLNRVNDFDYPRERVPLYQRLGIPGDPLDERYEGMTPKELARLERLERLIAGYGIRKDGAIVRGEDALNYADKDVNWSAFLNFQNLNDAILRRDKHVHEINLVETGPAKIRE